MLCPYIKKTCLHPEEKINVIVSDCKKNINFVASDLHKTNIKFSIDFLVDSFENMSTSKWTQF